MARVKILENSQKAYVLHSQRRGITDKRLGLSVISVLRVNHSIVIAKARASRPNGTVIDAG